MLRSQKFLSTIIKVRPPVGWANYFTSFQALTNKLLPTKIIFAGAIAQQSLIINKLYFSINLTHYPAVNTNK